MGKKYELTPEMKAKVEQFCKDHEMRPLSADELEDVSGGVPDYFEWCDIPWTPSELIELIDLWEKQFGSRESEDLLLEIVAPHYPDVNPQMIYYAYVTHHSAMFEWLDQPGEKYWHIIRN